ncbi:alpha/beta fold hydrolase [Bacillota bacterium Meth-B3]|nr:alpha/beta fold hydrolase [Christensenellaceae bacterium]MEA5065166.1 alpha/beta fold hydrolase [Eubacteriales bacterium]MEA5069308.1 alpha/beta fold hydrolase [Christensenellaceae bacterium]
MRTETLKVKSEADGLMLSVLIAEPEDEPRALVQIAHGMAEYKERYLGFIEALTRAGYAVLIHDHRGHGASAATASDLGYFGPAGAGGLLADLRQMAGLLTARHPGVPLCLFGHSMGSLAARAYARSDDGELSALIVCGCPSENPSAGAGRALVKVLKWLRGERHRSALMDKLTNGPFRRQMPALSGAFGWLNSDPEAVAAYERDEKCGFNFTLNGYEALMGLMKAAYARDGWALRKPELPILFISGADDPCMIDRARLDAAVGRMREVGYTGVSLHVYEGMRHEILLEPGRAQVYADVIAFLDRAVL